MLGEANYPVAGTYPAGNWQRSSKTQGVRMGNIKTLRPCQDRVSRDNNAALMGLSDHSAILHVRVHVTGSFMFSNYMYIDVHFSVL